MKRFPRAAQAAPNSQLHTYVENDEDWGDIEQEFRAEDVRNEAGLNEPQHKETFDNRTSSVKFEAFEETDTAFPPAWDEDASQVDSKKPKVSRGNSKYGPRSLSSPAAIIAVALGGTAPLAPSHSNAKGDIHDATDGQLKHHASSTKVVTFAGEHGPKKQKSLREMVVQVPDQSATHTGAASSANINTLSSAISREPDIAGGSSQPPMSSPIPASSPKSIMELELAPSVQSRVSAGHLSRAAMENEIMARTGSISKSLSSLLPCAPKLQFKQAFDDAKQPLVISRAAPYLLSMNTFPNFVGQFKGKFATLRNEIWIPSRHRFNLVAASSQRLVKIGRKEARSLISAMDQCCQTAKLSDGMAQTIHTAAVASAGRFDLVLPELPRIASKQEGQQDVFFSCQSLSCSASARTGRYLPYDLQSPSSWFKTVPWDGLQNKEGPSCAISSNVLDRIKALLQAMSRASTNRELSIMTSLFIKELMHDFFLQVDQRNSKATARELGAEQAKGVTVGAVMLGEAFRYLKDSLDPVHRFELGLSLLTNLLIHSNLVSRQIREHGGLDKLFHSLIRELDLLLWDLASVEDQVPLSSLRHGLICMLFYNRIFSTWKPALRVLMCFAKSFGVESDMYERLLIRDLLCPSIGKSPYSSLNDVKRLPDDVRRLVIDLYREACSKSTKRVLFDLLFQDAVASSFDYMKRELSNLSLDKLEEQVYQLHSFLIATDSDLVLSFIYSKCPSNFQHDLARHLLWAPLAEDVQDKIENSFAASSQQIEDVNDYVRFARKLIGHLDSTVFFCIMNELQTQAYLYKKLILAEYSQTLKAETVKNFRARSKTDVIQYASARQKAYASVQMTMELFRERLYTLRDASIKTGASSRTRIQKISDEFKQVLNNVVELDLNDEYIEVRALIGVLNLFLETFVISSRFVGRPAKPKKLKTNTSPPAPPVPPAPPASAWFEFNDTRDTLLDDFFSCQVAIPKWLFQVENVDIYFVQRMIRLLGASLRGMEANQGFAIPISRQASSQYADPQGLTTSLDHGFGSSSVIPDREMKSEFDICRAQISKYRCLLVHILAAYVPEACQELVHDWDASVSCVAAEYYWDYVQGASLYEDEFWTMFTRHVLRKCQRDCDISMIQDAHFLLEEFDRISKDAEMQKYVVPIDPYHSSGDDETASFKSFDN